MRNHRIDILNLEWPGSQRERHIITPVYLYLRERYGLKVRSENIFNGYYYLLRYRPKLLLLSNSRGSEINFLLAKTAYKLGIKVVALISEGNVEDGREDEFFWGWRFERTLYEDAKLLWSERSKNMFAARYPDLTDRLYVSGATGFDKYLLLLFQNKENFLKEHNFRSYSKVVGIAGWGFDFFFDGPIWKRDQEFLRATYGEKQIEAFRNDLVSVRDIYRNLIVNNPDTLFILRFHPGAVSFEHSEFYGLEMYPNVYVSDPRLKEYELISDLINVSDIWVAYSSTTAMEAWLLRKVTILVNPSGSRFSGNNLFEGSLVAEDDAKLQRYVEVFFNRGVVDEFEALAPHRKLLIDDIIGCADGKNHVRAAEIIYKIFQKAERERSWRNFPFIAMCRQAARFYMEGLFRKNNVRNEVARYEALYREAVKKEIYGNS